jgi:hypothetical protein
VTVLVTKKLPEKTGTRARVSVNKLNQRRVAMLFDAYFLEKEAQMQHREMVEAARLERLIREIEGQKPKLWQKLTGRVGDWMIGLGHRLKYAQTLMPKP